MARKAAEAARMAAEEAARKAAETEKASEEAESIERPAEYTNIQDAITKGIGSTLKAIANAVLNVGKSNGLQSCAGDATAKVLGVQSNPVLNMALVLSDISAGLLLKIMKQEQMTGK